jgi:hypothetical protein
LTQDILSCRPDIEASSGRILIKAGERPSGTRNDREQDSADGGPASPENLKRRKTIRAVRINIAILAVALALIMLAPSLLYTAHASTGNAGFPPFPYGTLGQTNYTCQYHSANSQLFLFRQPRFEQVKFTDSQCLGVDNSPALNGGLSAIINSSSSGNIGFTEGTSFSIAEIADSGFWTGCCVAGDKIFFDAALHGRLAFTGGADSLIRIIVKRQFTTCAYYDNSCHMWEWMAWNPYTNAPPSNVDRSFLMTGLTSGDASLDVGGQINGYYTRFYLDASIFANSGPIEIEVDALSSSAADGAGATADFATPGFYVAILDFGYIHRSPPVAPSIAAGVGTANGAYTNSPSICWNRVSDIEIITSYAVQIATDSAFSNIVASKTVPEVGASAYCYSTTLSDAHYYWRVEDSDNIGQTSAWSATYNFYVDTTPPTVPTLGSPQNNAITNNNQPTFTWNPSTDPGPTPSGVSYYALEISTSSTFNGYQYTTTSGTSKQAPILADGTWYWRVEAVDNVGNVGPWSATRSITVDTTPPSTPTLQSPSNGAVSTSTTQTLTWSAATDDNGVASYNIQLDTSTSFNSPNRISSTGITTTSYSLTLSPGVWYWRVQAVDKAGNAGSWSTYNTLNIADFSIASNPTSLTANRGWTATSNIYIYALSGFSGTVNLAWTRSPSTGTFICNLSQTSVTGSGQLVLGCFGDPGIYTVTVKGTSGTLSHSTTVTYTIQYFNIAANPTSLTVNGGGTSTITISPLNGFSANVVLTTTIANSPANFSCNLSPTTITGSGSSTLSCNGAAGNYVVTVTGTSGGQNPSVCCTISNSTNVSFAVQDFSISADPASQCQIPSSQTFSQLTFTSLNGFGGIVSLSASVSPTVTSGPSTSLGSSSVTLSSGSSTVATVWVTAGTATGSFTVTVTGTLANLSHSAQESVSIVSPSCPSGGGGGGSVAKGTLITMADGSKVPVQNLRVGDRMLGYDPLTGKYTVSIVNKITIVNTNNMLIIHTAEGTPFRTDANPRQTLWVKTAAGKIGWLPVTQIKPGDYLFTVHGWVRVTKIDYIPNGTYAMYDIFATVPYFASGYLDPIRKM